MTKRRATFLPTFLRSGFPVAFCEDSVKLSTFGNISVYIETIVSFSTRVRSASYTDGKLTDI